MERQHDLILSTARKRGLHINDVTEGDLVADISDGSTTHRIHRGTPLSLINLDILNIIDHKQDFKKHIRSLDIPVPGSVLFRHPEDQSVQLFFEPGQTYVCKPPDLTEGIGVRLGIQRLEEVAEYWKNNQHLSESFMLEEQFDGHDLRMQVIGGKIVAACIREPAFVIGDGTSSLQELIYARRNLITRQNSDNTLLVDGPLVLDQVPGGMTEIPPAGQKVQLNQLANMSQGAIATDVTEQLDEQYQAWITQLADHLGVGYFAADFMVKDSAAAPTSDNAVLLELNGRPEWLHHTFSEGRQHDVAGMVLGELFDL